jgi:two-component system alkaline phosphatase synthesis response regulator PhoP
VPNKTVLLVDDDVKIVELVALYLKRDGYRVLVAHDGVTALNIARGSRPDLIVLDLMLPGMPGLDVCRELRKESDVPIIMLTARTTEQDRLVGLDSGADDYVTKPFSPRELAARVRAVLRRSALEERERGPTEIRQGDLTMNLLTREVVVAGRAVRLTPIEFELLAVLAREPNRVFSRAQLIEKAIGFDFEGFDRTIDVHILNLRRKIEPDPKSSRYIKTVYGAGYRFVRE